MLCVACCLCPAACEMHNEGQDGRRQPGTCTSRALLEVHPQCSAAGAVQKRATECLAGRWEGPGTGLLLDIVQLWGAAVWALLPHYLLTMSRDSVPRTNHHWPCRAVPCCAAQSGKYLEEKVHPAHFPTGPAPPTALRCATLCPAAQFGKYLEEKARPEWRANYLDYKALKDLIKESASEDAAVSAEASHSFLPFLVVRFGVCLGVI